MEFYLYLSLCIKTNSKCIKGLNTNSETPKSLEENKVSAIYDIGVRKNFMRLVLHLPENQGQQLTNRTFKNLCTPKERRYQSGEEEVHRMRKITCEL